MLLAPEGDDGWGEWGLVKKTKTPQIPTMDSVPSRRIWLISRTKNYDQFMTIVPKNWKLRESGLIAGDGIYRVADRKSVV